MNKSIKSIKLLYRASTDGDSAKDFHSKCDGKANTVTFVKSKNGRRFGGFSNKEWNSNGQWITDNNAFVFSLETNLIYPIMKSEPAIGCYPKFGPVFFGCQIRIYDEFFTKGGTTCHKGLNYKTTKDYELNNGEQKYLIKDIEIYSIETIDI